MRFILAVVLYLASFGANAGAAQVAGGFFSSASAAGAACTAAAQPKGRSCNNTSVSNGEWNLAAFYGYFSSDPEQVFFYYKSSPGCASGWTDDANSKCKETCSTGQVNNSAGQCVASPGPAAGDSAGPQWVDMGQGDGNGGVATPSPARSTLMGGGSVAYSCGGYECKTTIQGHNGDCQTWSSNGHVYCEFDFEYTGQGAPEGAEEPPTSNSTPTDTVDCPVGYVKGPGGICNTIPTSGTPSTATTPGSAPQPGSATCPVGYALNANRQCVSTSTSSSCPSGYTLQNGFCESTSTVPTSGVSGGTGTGSGQGQTCGGPGQVACSVVLEAPTNISDIDSATHSISSEQQLDNADTTITDGLNNWSSADPSLGSQQSFTDLFSSYLTGIGHVGCQPFSATISGRTWSWDHCDIAAKLSAIGDYALWIYLLFGSFILIVGRNGGDTPT